MMRVVEDFAQICRAIGMVFDVFGRVATATRQFDFAVLDDLLAGHLDERRMQGKIPAVGVGCQGCDERVDFLNVHVSNP